MLGFKIETITQNNCVDLRLYQVGKEICQPGHHYGPVTRNHYLFHLVTSGKGTFISDKAGTFEIEKGSGFLICPNQITTYYADKEDPWSYIWIEVDGIRTMSLFKDTGLTIETPVILIDTETLLRKIVFQIEYILNNAHESSTALLGHTYLLFDSLAQNSTRYLLREEKPKKNIDYFDEVLGYIEKHYSEDISIEYLAGLCKLNRSYLNSLFKKEFGLSLQQYLMKFRLTKATELLQSTELPIKEICSLVGYGNQLHFSKMFKQQFGLAPSYWRISNSNNILHN